MMKRLLHFVFPSLIVLFSCHTEEISFANPEDLEYFPLAVGNRWEYEPLDTNVSTFISGTFTITGVDVRGGHEYFVMVRDVETNYTSYSDTVLYRVDNRGYVFKISSLDARERNIFRLGASNGYKWTMENSPYKDLIVTTTYQDKIVNNELTPDCKDFYFNSPEIFDEEHSYVLAKGIGIIQHNNFWGFNYKLKSVFLQP